MESQQTRIPTSLPYPKAVHDLLDQFAWNPWFLNTYWPENEPRVRLMAQLALNHFSNPLGRPALEVGCANGFVAYLFRRLGFEVVAVDVPYDDPKRLELFEHGNIPFQGTNLNEVNPLSELASESYDLVLLGEVFEHILNQPTGLLKSIFRLLRPGGLLILTTPNPSTLANAFRLLRDSYILWGTPEFMRHTKIDGDKIIDRGDIHYREYPAWIVRDLLKELGYQVLGCRYIRSGTASTQSWPKRLVKHLIRLMGLSGWRLLAPGYVLWAKRPN